MYHKMFKNMLHANARDTQSAAPVDKYHDQDMPHAQDALLGCHTRLRASWHACASDGWVSHALARGARVPIGRRVNGEHRTCVWVGQWWAVVGLGERLAPGADGRETADSTLWRETRVSGVC